MTRPFRGATYEIEILRTDDLPAGVSTELELDGRRLEGTLVPAPRAPGDRHRLRARCR
jgi:hypothetical protein